MEASNNFFQQTKQILKTIAMIISWTIFALLVLIIGFLAYYMVSANIYAKKGEKFEPKFSLYTIVSPSMEPNIKVYDVILNTRIDDPADIKVGDVITFISTSTISNGMTVTHRVTRIENGPDGLEFATKGDNNITEDTDTAKQANLLGKVVLKIPQLGRLQFFLSTKGGWLLVIIFPALLIIVNDIFKIFKLNKAKKNLEEAEENDENKDEKLKLETFRKEEIKNKLTKKELQKAKKLENKLKNKDIEETNDLTQQEAIEEIEIKEEKADPLNNEITEDAEFIPVIDETELSESNDVEPEETVINEDKVVEENEIMFEPISIEENKVENSKSIVQEDLVKDENNILINSNDGNKEQNNNTENLSEEEIIFEPALKEEEVNNSTSDVKNNEQELDYKKDTKENNEVPLKHKNIFDEVEQHNIFTDNNISNLFDDKEPLKKENDIPLDFELPKLKDIK